MGRQNLSNYKVFFAFYFFFCPAAWVPIRAPPFGIPLYSPALGPHLGTPLGLLFLLKFFCASQIPCFIMVLGPFSEDALPGGSPEGVLWRALGGRSPGCLELIWRASGGPILQLPFGTPLGDPLADPYFCSPPETEVLSSISRVSGTFETGFSFLASWAPREHPQHLKSSKSTVIMTLFACGAPKPQQL